MGEKVNEVIINIISIVTDGELGRGDRLHQLVWVHLPCLRQRVKFALRKSKITVHNLSNCSPPTYWLGMTKIPGSIPDKKHLHS